MTQGWARNVVAAMLSSFVVAVVCGFTLSDNASAQSRVTAVNGLVTYVGDDAPHELVVRASNVDISKRAWHMATGAGSAFLVASAKEAAQHLRIVQLGMRTAFENFDLSNAFPGDYDQRFDDARWRYGDLIERSNELDDKADALWNLMDSVAEREGVGDRWFALSNEYYTIVDENLAIANELDSLDETLERLRPSWLNGLDSEAGAKLLRYTRGLRRGLESLLRVAYLGGEVILVAELTWSVASLFSDRVLLIEDTTGNPINAVLPCRQHVRSLVEGELANTVSCPAPTFPSPIHGPVAGLYIKGGGAKDTVDLTRVPAGGPFSEAIVEGNGGDDTIWGSTLGERMFGGAGNDQLFGQGGDDVLYGYGPPFVSTGGAANPDNDRVVGGAGEDALEGGPGHDVLMGGRANDAGWFGPMSGGAGNDVLVGGPGNDEMEGGTGRNTILAKESDFPAAITKPAIKLPDEFDGLIDCGETGVATQSPPVGGQSETRVGCSGFVGAVPTFDYLLSQPPPADGKWPWLN